MVYCASWPPTECKFLNGTIRWLTLPEGNYKVTALIADKELGVMSAPKLREGLPVSLGVRCAEFFRFEKQ